MSMNPLFDSFIFGAANSLHCAFMCGPLAAVFHGAAAGSIAYHTGRLSAYAAVGATLGGAGSMLGTSAIAAPSATVAFVLAAGLVLLATCGTRGAIAWPWLGRMLTRAMARARGLRPTVRAGLLGLLTPLLPCGLLWSACTGAALAGSAPAGGQVMAGFALGSLPALAAAQAGSRQLTRWLGPSGVAWAQRIAMLAAAAVLLWRGIVSMQGSTCCPG